LGFAILAAAAILKIPEFFRLKSAGAYSVFLSLPVLIFYSSLTIDRNRDWSDELTIFAKTVRTNPYCREAHACLGFAYHEHGMLSSAIAEYQKALTSDPRYYSYVSPPRLLENLGKICYDQKQYRQSEEFYKKSLDYNPSSLNARFELGAAYYGEGRYQDAIAEFKSVLTIDPGFANARYNLGMAYTDLGRYADAVKEYKEIVNASGEDVAVYYNLGATFEKAGERSSAAAAYKRALALEPGNSQIIESLKRLAADP
jgi:tetratricopeptide (TPR) repeat protein